MRPRANDTARRANGTSAACRECMFDSEVFNASWFGGFDTAAPLHVVRDGRFAYLPVPADPAFAESNSFGRLTDVYNQDPSPCFPRPASSPLRARRRALSPPPLSGMKS